MSDARIKATLADVETELRKALDRFPAFNSPHEGKAVIEEELDELWEHVKANTGRSLSARQEAIQVAAMALRYVIDVSMGIKCFDHDAPDCPICLRWADEMPAVSPAVSSHESEET